MFFQREKKVFSIKLVFPGEYALSDTGQIGTFAAGAKDGCRAYLLYDLDKNLAGCAHVDFKGQDEDVFIEMRQRMISKGAKRIVFMGTMNMSEELMIRLKDMFVQMQPIESSQFLFDVETKELSFEMNNEDRKRTFKDRQAHLVDRLRRNDRKLVDVS